MYNLLKNTILYINWGYIGENATHESAGLYKYTGKSFVSNGTTKFIFTSEKTGEQLSPLTEELLKGKCTDLGTLKPAGKTEIDKTIFAS